MHRSSHENGVDLFFNNKRFGLLHRLNRPREDTKKIQGLIADYLQDSVASKDVSRKSNHQKKVSDASRKRAFRKFILIAVETLSAFSFASNKFDQGVGNGAWPNIKIQKTGARDGGDARILARF